MAADTFAKPAGSAEDWTVPQHWERFTPAEHALWDQLYARQTALLPGRVTPEFFEGLNALDFARPGIPDFDRLSDKLMKATGWQVAAVPSLVPDDVFFAHLADRRFIAGNFIRKPEQIDYLQEPDVFHDVFGHVPLLANPVFADYMQAYGEGGLRAGRHGVLPLLARLYWYTVEFGLIRSNEGLRIFGAGIVSSRSETRFALDDASPNRIALDLARLMRTEYRIDDFQQTYFVIDSFEDLLDKTLRTDFAPLYEALRDAPTIAPDTVLPEDTVIHRGTQEYACDKARQNGENNA